MSPGRTTTSRTKAALLVLAALGMGLPAVHARATPPPVRAVQPGKPPEIKPYVPPRIEAEPALDEADTKVVTGPAEQDLPIVVRPQAGMPALGFAPPGTRLPVKGMYDAATPRGCPTKRWYAIEPRGWVCSGWVRRSNEPPMTSPVMTVPEGKSLPFAYVMVGGDDTTEVPLWANVEDMKAGAAPAFKLKKGDTVAVKIEPKPLMHEGATYHVAEDGRVLPAKGTFSLGEKSQWQGVPISETATLPFAWVTPAEAKVYPGAEVGSAIEKLARRTRVAILEESGTGARRRIRVGDGRWMRAADLNEARLYPQPTGATTHNRWIDVDLGEQVLVAYEGDRPVFATLVSSGRAITTPRGNYPIWAKVSHITMKSQPYEDKTYYVDRVPWAMFFQAHNAIHGAYWHDRFGVTKSHGCVNVAPRDARWLFAWVPPELPPAWSGTRTPNLNEGVTVHVRDSHQRKPFVQERNIGPPDREQEKLKLDEADARRLQAAAQPPSAAVPSAAP